MTYTETVSANTQVIKCQIIINYDQSTIGLHTFEY